MKLVAAAGFNPARQKVISFKKIVRGSVNRAVGMEEFASGKGINFCRAAACCGKVKTKLVQFCGGVNGDFVDAGLRQEGMDFISVRTKAPTRCCDTCIDLADGSVTELIETSYPAEAGEVEDFVRAFAGVLKQASAAALCGTLPTGTDKNLYARLARLSAEFRVPLLVDAWRDVDGIFSSGAEIMLKINREELAALTGESGVEEGLRAVTARWGIRRAAITDGPGRAFASDGTRIACYDLPELPEVVNTIGCGDTASAVWCSEMLSGSDVFEAFRSALGAASANCLTSLCGDFAPAEAERLARETTVKWISR
ncbi:MAG: hypothetical protein IJU70_03400 [Lentisphaeria bacterium]|nr:hypothetical protein [Lentisphaeria bacterium]